MNELIKVVRAEVAGSEVQTCDARELHAFLEVGKDFSNWIKDRIEQYGFIENNDFVCSPVLASNGRGGHNRKEYHLAIDMAKELAMVERNEKGRQARQYFIECERVAKEGRMADPLKALNDPAMMRGLLLTYTEKVIALEAANQEMRPTVVAFNRIADADGSLSLRESAKALQYPERKLHQYMHAADWLFRSPKGNWMGYADKTKAGYLTHKVTPYFDEKTQEDKVSHQVRVTPAGLAKLAKMLGVDFETVESATPAA